MPVKLGELLLKEKRITPEQLQEALNHQKTNGGKLGNLRSSSASSRTRRSRPALAPVRRARRSTSRSSRSIPAVIKLIPAETAQKYQIIPLSRSGATLTIAMTDPTNVFAMDDIKFMTGYNVEPVVASETAVDRGDRALLRPTALEPARRGAGSGGYGSRRRPSLKARSRTAELSVDDMASTELSRSTSTRSATPRRRRGPRGARGDQRRGAGQAGRGGAGHPARQRRADVGDLRRARATSTSSRTRRSSASATASTASSTTSWRRR